MSNTEVKMPLAVARELAQSLVEQLSPHCKTVTIAGSIRREKANVGDIEIVCLPKRIDKVTPTIFGDQIELVVHPDFVQAVTELAPRIIKGKPDGKYMQLEGTHRFVDNSLEFLSEYGIKEPGKQGVPVEHTIKIDIFMPSPEDFGRQLAIRTGSADYSYKVIAQRWKNKGWCGTPQGLRRRSECIMGANETWSLRTDIRKPTLPPAFDTEKAFFDFLQLMWVEPREREYRP